MTRTLPTSPGAILGYRRDGRPIRLQAGGDETAGGATQTQEPATARPQLNELEDTLRDKDKVMQLLKDGRFAEFMKDYADRKSEANSDLLSQVREETERVMTQWIRDNGGELKRLNLDPDQGVKDLARRKGAAYNRRAPGAKLDETEPPQDLAEFLQAVWHNVDKLDYADDLRAKTSKWREIQNSFGSTVPKDGGFLIPEVLRAEILQLAMESAIVRGRAQVIPMSSLAVPIPTVDETSRVSSVFGGMVAYWTEEGARATRSQAKFGRVRLEAKKLTVYCEAPDELIADAPAFGGFLSTSMPRATTFYEDVAFLTGSGVGEPLGVLNTSNKGLIQTSRDAGTGINFTDVVNVFTRLLPGSYESAVWLVAPDTIPDL
ncbi:MAG: phage major capsid protein, partial [Actinomycetota bacterium]